MVSSSRSLIHQESELTKKVILQRSLRFKLYKPRITLFWYISLNRWIVLFDILRRGWCILGYPYWAVYILQEYASIRRAGTIDRRRKEVGCQQGSRPGHGGCIDGSDWGDGLDNVDEWTIDLCITPWESATQKWTVPMLHDERVGYTYWLRHDVETPLSTTPLVMIFWHCTASLRNLLHCMSSTPKDSRLKRQSINKSTIFTGLLLFLGLSWILSQTTVVHKFKQHFPGSTGEEMSNKRTVGYFVCLSSPSRDKTDW